MSILEYLVEKKLLDKKNIAEIKEQIRSSDKNLDDVLEERGLDVSSLMEAKSEYFNVPVRNLGDTEVPFDILKYIPEESATHYQFVPLAVNGGFLEVGVVNPDNIEARDALNFISSREDIPFKIFIISKKDFDKVLNVYKGLSGQVTKALSELEEDELGDSDESILEKEVQKGLDETKIIEDAPVKKIVATIIKYAVEGNASDVHIEVLRDKVRVRFRVDGELTTSIILPSKVHDAVVARIKILSKMKLDEKRLPQDGRFSARVQNRKIDFRVSTFPSYYGEKVVMRILDQDKGVKPLEELGFSPEYLKMIKDAIEKPYGLVLISGPTGSGKTTTLYSILNALDKEGLNVLSLEDPVEYSIEGVSQSQVHAEIGYTFATGLRTTLRQDPDVILVGEIRDAETARLAIQAALTGHLVFSTIHTNNATGIVPRLIDMGIDPFLIPPVLILGVAQRLVRKICPGSGELTQVEGSVKLMLEKQFEDLSPEVKATLPPLKEYFKLKPNDECPNGTRGRVAVFEMFEMNREIEEVILKNPVDTEIYKAVRKQGMITMKEHSIIKALNKEIPFEEINKL
ncbi:MAG: type II/IV secretion system protein [Candidatus Pacebacteria bacterium]|nr:type II/IV secretion system protein [Candidatus Paceibacterota bacterium]